MKKFLQKYAKQSERKQKCAKKELPNLKCAEIEEYENKQDFNAHKKVKEGAVMITGQH